MHRSKSYLATEAISEYVSIQEWQIAEIKKSLKEADRGDFVNHAQLVKRWEKKHADKMDKNR